MGRSTYLSVVIPIYNEEESVSLLQASIRQALQDQNYSYEVIYVDDGSTDGTFQRLRDIVERDHHVHIIKLRRNFGQTAAISAGVAHSSGEILVFMDGDLQNDPKDIVRLLAKIDEGYDVVSGWRRNRKDAHLSRKLPSWLANRLISKVTGVFLHDYGCTLKAYRREIFQHIRLYGEMHRFIPAYAGISGARIAEIEVEHHSRRFGKSKYGISRTARVILDLATVKFLGSFSTKPNYAFGIPGLIALTIGGMLGGALVVRKVLPPHVRIHRNPLLPISLHLSGFGIHVPLYFYFIAIPFIALVTYLPISINGFGLREGAFVFIFSTIHVASASSLLLALFMDAQALLFGLIGICIYLKMGSINNAKKTVLRSIA